MSRSSSEIMSTGPRPSHTQQLQLLARAFSSTPTSSTHTSSSATAAAAAAAAAKLALPGPPVPPPRDPRHQSRRRSSEDCVYVAANLTRGRRRSQIMATCIPEDRGGGCGGGIIVGRSTGGTEAATPKDQRSSRRRRNSLRAEAAAIATAMASSHGHVADGPAVVNSRGEGRRRSSMALAIRRRSSNSSSSLRRSSVGSNDGAASTYVIPLSTCTSNDFHRSSSSVARLSFECSSSSSNQTRHDDASPPPPPRPSLSTTGTSTSTPSTNATPSRKEDQMHSATVNGKVAAAAAAAASHSHCQFTPLHKANRPLPSTPEWTAEAGAGCVGRAGSEARAASALSALVPPALPKRNTPSSDRTSRINLFDLGAMTESERIAVMRSVSDGTLSVDSAASKVKAFGKQVMMTSSASG